MSHFFRTSGRQRWNKDSRNNLFRSGGDPGEKRGKFPTKHMKYFLLTRRVSARELFVRIFHKARFVAISRPWTFVERSWEWWVKCLHFLLSSASSHIRDKQKLGVRKIIVFIRFVSRVIHPVQHAFCSSRIVDIRPPFVIFKLCWGLCSKPRCHHFAWQTRHKRGEEILFLDQIYELYLFYQRPQCPLRSVNEHQELLTHRSSWRSRRECTSVRTTGSSLWEGTNFCSICLHMYHGDNNVVSCLPREKPLWPQIEVWCDVCSHLYVWSSKSVQTFAFLGKVSTILAWGHYYITFLCLTDFPWKNVSFVWSDPHFFCKQNVCAIHTRTIVADKCNRLLCSTHCLQPCLPLCCLVNITRRE